MNSEDKHIIVPESVAECLSESLDIEKNKELIDWLKAEENRKTFNQLNDIWQSSLLIMRDDKYDIIDAWKKVDSSIPLKKRRKIGRLSTSISATARSWFFAASIFALAIFLGVLGYNSLELRNRKLHYTEYSVPYGSRSNILLPDGSKVWINAGSVLKYSSDFSLKNREVFLSGEAFFKVAEGSRLPFEVKLKTISFKALGTSFNIKAYEDESVIEATVVEGKVQIASAGKTLINRSNIYLGSNQKLIITNSKSLKSKPSTQFSPSRSGNQYRSTTTSKSDANCKIISNINPNVCTSWKDEQWIIEQERLDNFAVMLQRRYNVKIIFANQGLKEYIFSGIIKDETLEQVLDAIYLTAPIEYRVNGNTITFKRNNRFPGVQTR